MSEQWAWLSVKDSILNADIVLVIGLDAVPVGMLPVEGTAGIGVEHQVMFEDKPGIVDRVGFQFADELTAQSGVRKAVVDATDDVEIVFSAVGDFRGAPAVTHDQQLFGNAGGINRQIEFEHNPGVNLHIAVGMVVTVGSFNCGLVFVVAAVLGIKASQLHCFERGKTEPVNCVGTAFKLVAGRVFQSGWPPARMMCRIFSRSSGAAYRRMFLSRAISVAALTRERVVMSTTEALLTLAGSRSSSKEMIMF